jgi:hypothetical protein
LEREYVVKLGILALGSAMALLSAPVIFASPASAKPCPSGTAQTKWPGVCTKSGSNAPAFLPPGSTPGGGANVVSRPGELPSVNGVPCTPEHYGTCLAMQQSGR